MKRFNINLPDTLYEMVRKKAFYEKRSMSELIVDVLETQYKDIPRQPQTQLGKKIAEENSTDIPQKTVPRNSICKHSRMKGLCEYGCK